jgi:hypothetical protein
MKVTLKEVKFIMGFDSKLKDKFGKFSHMTVVSDEAKELMGTYMYNQVKTNAQGENIFYVRASQEFLAFDKDKKVIAAPINEVFLADVRIEINEFQSKNDGVLEFESDGSPKMVRFYKCIGIEYIKKVENEDQKVAKKFDDPTDYDSIWADETELVIPTIAAPLQAIVNNDPLNVDAPVGGVDESGLPF